MSKLTQYDLPVPAKEKVARVGFWILSGVAAVAGAFYGGPYVLAGLNNLLDITNVLVRLSAIAGTAFITFLLMQALWPAIKNRIAVFGYQAINFMRENYPLEQLDIWLEYLQAKLKETKEGELVAKGVEKQTRDNSDALQTRLDAIAQALDDRTAGLTPSERADLELEASGALQEKQVYDKMLEQLQEPLDTVRMFVDFQERKISEFRILMRVSNAQFTTNAGMTQVNRALRDVYGESEAKENAIRARENIVSQLGQTFGELEGMQTQVRNIIRAAGTQDKVGLSSARKYLTDRMRTIEGVAVRVPEPVTVRQGSRLLDK